MAKVINELLEGPTYRKQGETDRDDKAAIIAGDGFVLALEIRDLTAAQDILARIGNMGMKRLPGKLKFSYKI